MLDVRKLNALREIAIRGSFSAAAEQLHYSQSAISQQVAQLEKQVGTLLIERGGRGIRLTSAGRALVDHTDLILRHMTEAEAELEAITGLRQSALRVVTFGSAAATFMPGAIQRFRASHPGTVITMCLAESVAAMALVSGGEADIAVISRYGPGAACAGVVVTDLLDDPMRVAVPREHPLAGHGEVRLADLAEESWILATTGGCADWEIFVAACRLAGFEPRIALRNDDYLAIQGFVAAGLGVALLPSLVAVAAMTRADIVVRPLGPNAPVRSIGAAVFAGTGQSPSVAAMLAELRAGAAECATVS
jgi:molybdate transport repressor ModE-like protein